MELIIPNEVRLKSFIIYNIIPKPKTLMKKTLLFLLSIVVFSQFFTNSYAQSFSVGYRLGSGTFKPLDFVIDRYNQTRTAILTKNMDKISNVSGIVYSLGFNAAVYGFELEIPKLKSSVVTAETSTQVRESYLELSGFELNVSYATPVFEEGNVMGFIGGSLSTDFSTPTFHTRIYNKGATAPEYSAIKAGSSVNVGLGPTAAVHFFLPSFLIFAEVRPFYKLSITGADFYDVNRGLNPNTWTGDNIDDTEGSMSYYGVNMRLGISLAL